MGASQLAAPPFRPRFQSEEGGPYSAQKMPSEVDSLSLDYYNDYVYPGKTGSAQKPHHNQFGYNSTVNVRGRGRGKRGRKPNINPHQLNFGNENVHETLQYTGQSFTPYAKVAERKFKEGLDFVGSEQ